MIPAISTNEMMTIITWRKTFVNLDGLGFRFGLTYRGLIDGFIKIYIKKFSGNPLDVTIFKRGRQRKF